MITFTNFYEWFFQEKDRPAAGLFSFGHLFSVTLCLAIFLTGAYFLAKLFRGNEKKQNLVLLISGIAIIVLEIIKIVYCCVGTNNLADAILGNWPLYFCDIPIYVVLVSALSKGRVKDCCLDFLAICGLLMGFMGNYFAGNIYGSHAAFSFFALNSLLNHSLSAFVSLFIWVSKLNKMEKRNIPFVIGILFTFMTIALILDYCFHKNFMFFFFGDGTPFTLFFDLVRGNLILYQMIIYILQCGYIGLFYVVYYAIIKQYKKKHPQEAVSN